MAAFRSPQSFVRTLKAPTDPPTPDGPFKIDIARQVWDDTSFHVPNKSEIVADWILNKLSKEKGKDPSLNPILDVRFWNLLCDIISSTNAPLEVNTRPLKSWLPPLLNRVSVAPILTSLFNLLEDIDSLPRKQLFQLASSCFIIIWPLTVQKMSTEVLLECFSAFLRLLHLYGESNEDLTRIGIMVVSSYRSSLWNFSNKKKIYLTFLQNCLRLWLECSLIKTGHTSNNCQRILEITYDAGVDTLFNLDILRQTRDSKSETVFFEAIATISFSNTSILAILPRIFASYIQTTRKYRGSLFGQGSTRSSSATTEEFNAAGMNFFISCQSLLDGTKSNKQAWLTRVSLLSLVDQENIFSRKQMEAVAILNHYTNLTIDILKKNCDVEQVDLSTYAIEALTALMRIDYDFVLPNLSRVLPTIILFAKPSQPFFIFLDLLLDYYTKTRTINIHITNILSALSFRHLLVVSGDAQKIYHTSHSGPIMDTTHLEPFSKSIQGFLQGTQALPTIDSVLDSLNQAWKQLYNLKDVSDNNYNDNDKTRRATETPSTVSEQDNLAILFSLSARIASVVLSSLPWRSVPENIHQELRQKLSGTRDSFLSRILTKTFKHIRKGNRHNAWAFQVVAAASLRLQYALDRSRNAVLASYFDSKLCSKMADILQIEELLPELKLELFRALLNKATLRDEFETKAVIDQLLQYLIENFKASDVHWSGNPHQLSFNERGMIESALALVHMIIERWLPVVDSIASPEQLKTLVQLIISIHTRNSGQSSFGLQQDTLLKQTLHSAHFWEYQNIRSALLAHLNEATLILDGNPNLSQISGAVTVYRTLLLFPVEYVSRSFRSDLIRRAIAADALLARSSMGSEDISKALVTFRIFLKRVFSYDENIEYSIQQLCDYLENLMAVNNTPSQKNEEFTSATVDLMESVYVELFQISMTSNASTISRLLQFLSQLHNRSLSYRNPSIRALSIMRMISVLTSRFSLTRFSQDVQASIYELFHNLSSEICLQMSENTIASMSQDTLIEHDDMMALWSGLLSLGNWLGSTGDQLPRVGMSLVETVSKIGKTQGQKDIKWDNFLVTTSSILLRELHYLPEADYTMHLDLVLATYVAFSGTLGTNGRRQLDNHLSKACKNLSLLHFSRVLELIAEALTNTSTPIAQLTPLIELSTLLLRDHPQGALKHIQKHITECISAFSARIIFTEGPIQLRVQVLEFISQHCADRPAVLRLMDIGSIWTLLARFLAGSPVHDDETTVVIFHKIIMVVNALIRLRRDLVKLSLPHLGIILRQLLMTMRSTRPLLGVKQTALITDTLPRWINSRYPLGVDEAKLLARLLETLTAKSVVRNNSIVEAQKAQSLAKPFSKHAAYVLKAYVEAMNDPLCLLQSEPRRELQPGLYALCSMMSDHSRDAMMVSALDAGGKTIMKTLWKEYEKQKYIGKG